MEPERISLERSSLSLGHSVVTKRTLAGELVLDLARGEDREDGFAEGVREDSRGPRGIFVLLGGRHGCRRGMGAGRRSESNHKRIQTHVPNIGEERVADV
jgi:hypothetical protein